MVRSETQVTLELRGGAVLCRPDRAPLRFERKTAALLAYLALEGATPRSVMAGLLWPDSLEATARGNLRQLLRRLRDNAGTDLIVGDDPLMLTADIAVDAVQPELSTFAGDDAAVLRSAGELLEGLEFEECSELTDWLLGKREALSSLRAAALERLTDTCQRNGDLRAALLHAEKLLKLDAVSEVAHRRVMRLHYLNGDRGAALRAYRRCHRVLMRELNVAPLAETSALAAIIEAGQPLELPAAQRLELPPSIQRPPLLVGRLREWDLLESAWAAGLGIAVSGEAGVGKSRLTLEFVSSKGRYALIQGRPGDAGVPYSTLARSLRQTLGDHPELELAAWVRLELSRLIPSLTTETPPAISSDEGKLRFFESIASALEPLIEGGLVALVLEDLQFADAASLEAGQYLAARFVMPGGTPRLRSLLTYRSGELSSDAEVLMKQGVSAGQVALIDLKPLEPPHLEALLSGLGVALPSGLPAALGRHSGGNPLFALETLRSLIERGDLTRDLTGRLPVPKRLESLVAGRLERLTPQAQRLARCAAVAGTEFGLELAQAVLETSLLDVSEALSELEAAQVMIGERFSHDLLTEFTFSSIPAPVRALLHRRIALHLEATGAAPISIAKHFSSAGDVLRASAWWLRAAWGFYVLGGTAAATEVFERLTQQSALSAATRLEARYGLGLCLIWSDPTSSQTHLQTVIEEAALIGDLQRELEARAALAQNYQLCGRLRDGLEQLAHLLQRHPPEATPQQQAEVYRSRFWLELRSGRLSDAELSITEALRLSPEDGSIENERAMLYWHQGRFKLSAQMFETYRASSAGSADPDAWIMTAGNMAWTYWALGRGGEATALLQQQLGGVRSPFEEGLTRSNFATVLISAARYRDALMHLKHAQTQLAPYDLHSSDVHHRLGHIHYLAGRSQQALAALNQALLLGRAVGDPYRLSYILATFGAALARAGDAERGLAAAREALGIARNIHFPLATAIALQGLCVVLLAMRDASSTLEHAREASALARSCGMVEQLGAARLLEGLCGGSGAKSALEEALEVADAHGFPYLAWQAATALGSRKRVAHFLGTLRNQSPPGWFASQS